MVYIKELEKADKNTIHIIAELHKKAFPSFFLTQLGVVFLSTLYQGYMEDKDSGIIVAETNGEIIGFIAYSRDYSHFYKELLKNHLLRFAFCSFVASIKHPSFIKRLLGAFKKSDAVKKEEKYVELSSICVDPKIESKGIGSKLISYLKEMIDFNTYAYINLETDAVNNEVANHFYKKNGFKLERQFTTSEGRIMNEYRFSQGAE